MKKKRYKILLYACLLGFILLNIISFNHAYKFMHYSDSTNTSQIEIPEDVLTITKMLLLGADIPRPKNTIIPSFPYKTKKICNDEIECWISDHPEKKNAGTVLIFHGYVASKDSMLDRAEYFYDLGYKVILADFKGGGGSKGNSVELGYGEADQVADIFQYFNKDEPLYLYGCSMGSVAIMRAISKHKIKPKAILLECPFGSLYETVVSRFQFMNIPSFPFARILLFWGSLQNGFNGWDHNCYDYAKDIKVPTLLMLGDNDPFVTKKEINEIFDNLNGKKYLKIFSNSSHESYLKHDSLEWENGISEFLEEDVYIKDMPRPKNFVQAIVVAGEILEAEVDMHKYAVQITVADERDGALSGSTLKEASSWGKVETTYEQMVYSEATLAMPLISGYSYHKGAWKNRPERRWNDFLDK